MAINVEATLLFLGTIAAFGLLASLHISHRRGIKRSRAAVYENCLSLFTSYQVTQDDVDYPVLSGQFKGHRIELKLIADHVGYRKVPSLWLQASVLVDLPVRGVTDYLVRPQNVEFFSPSDTLTVQLPVPLHWPQFASLRTDQHKSLPWLHLLDPSVALFEDPAMKELLLTPRGTRLVRQVDQARRTEYLVLRASSFEHDQLEPEIVAQLLNTQIALIDSLLASASTSSRATLSSSATLPGGPDTTEHLQVQHA